MAQVLIINDNDEIRLAMRAILEDLDDHTVSEADDGVQGLEQLRASPTPLVVLVDLLMPHLNGLGFLEAVAADPCLATRHAYILMTAGRELIPPDIPAALKSALQYLAKPFDLNELLEVVASAAHQLPPSSHPSAGTPEPM